MRKGEGRRAREREDGEKDARRAEKRRRLKDRA